MFAALNKYEEALKTYNKAPDHENLEMCIS